MIEPLDSISFHPIIEIQVSCKDLVKPHGIIDSGTICVFYVYEKGHYSESDRTEVVFNKTDITFFKKFKTFYIFESHQPLRFEIYDTKSNTDPLNSRNLIGSYETNVYNLVKNLNQTLICDLNIDKNKKKDQKTQIILSCRQTKESNSFLRGQIIVRNLKKMKTFAKNNPYFEISKSTFNGKMTVFTPVYRSEIKKKCFGCMFKPFLIPLQALYPDNNQDKLIKIAFYDYSKRKQPKLIFECINSLHNFMDPTRIKKGQNEENIIFSELKIIRIPTIADYFKNGVQLKMITAIDFSNSEKSVHLALNKNDEYIECIQLIGSILAKYDGNERFYVYGFGGEINKNNQLFPLTFDDKKRWVTSPKEIIDSYRAAITKVNPLKHANFAPVINEAINIATSFPEGSHTYSILLILTDGIIGDMKETVDAIVEASKQPLSIIIVGIGSADFSKMEELDADDLPLKSEGKGVMERDSVQFVQYEVFKNKGSYKLESEVLAELPLQIHNYYSTHYFLIKPEDDK